MSFNLTHDYMEISWVFLVIWLQQCIMKVYTTIIKNMLWILVKPHWPVSLVYFCIKSTAPVYLVPIHVSEGSFCRLMPSQTQIHTILRSPGPAVDPAFSPSTPEREKKQDDFCKNEIRVKTLDRTAHNTSYTVPFLFKTQNMQRKKWTNKSPVK